MRKIDIDTKDNFDKLVSSIKQGTYDFWIAENYTGFEEYRTGEVKINDIDSLRCSKSNLLNQGNIIFLLLLFLI